MDADENFTKEQIEAFENDPELYMKFVKAVEKEINSKFKMVSRPRADNTCIELKTPNQA